MSVSLRNEMRQDDLHSDGPGTERRRVDLQTRIDAFRVRPSDESTWPGRYV